MGKKELNSQNTKNVINKEEKPNTEKKNKPKNKYDIVANIHPDDAKDKVFVAIIKALVKNGNTPSTPKELSQYILKHKLTNLGGSTPFATVSSRISQHFKKCSEHKPGHSPRPPLLGKKTFDGMHSRKLYYFIDSPYIKVADIPNPLTKLAAQKIEAKNEKKKASDTPQNKKKEKIQPRITRSRSSAKSTTPSENGENKTEINKITKEIETKKKDINTNNDDDNDDNVDDNDTNNNNGDNDDNDDDDDEDNESLIKIKEKIQKIKKNSNNNVDLMEEEKNSKKVNDDNVKAIEEDNNIQKVSNSNVNPLKEDENSKRANNNNVNPIEKGENNEKNSNSNNNPIEEGENNKTINNNSNVNSAEEKKNSKKHGIENSDSNKAVKHQKISNDAPKTENKKAKKGKRENNKMEVESDEIYTKKDIDPSTTQSFDNKPDELIRQLSSDINDLVSVSLISSKPNDLEMELLSDYSSDFSVSTHAVSTEQSSEGINTIDNKPWNVPPELISMNELDSLFSESDLDDTNITSEDSKSVDSFSTNKRKFDTILASENDYSLTQEPKKINSSVVNTFLKKNHVKRASGLSHEITTNFDDNESESVSKEDSGSDNKSDNSNKMPVTSNENSENSETIEKVNLVKKEVSDDHKKSNLPQTNRKITIKEEKEEIESNKVEIPTEKVENPVSIAKEKNVTEEKPAPLISIEMFYPSSKELIRIFTEAYTNIEYNSYHVKLRKIIHGKLNGDIVFFKKPYSCFSELSVKENIKLNPENDLEMSDVNINGDENSTNPNYKLEKINTDISCSGFVDISSFFRKKELSDSILQKCHEKIKTKSTEFLWWEQYVNNIIEWSNFINSRLSLSIKMKELLQNTKVEIEDVNTMKKANVIVVCLIKNKTNLLESTNEPESLHRYKSLNVFSNMSLDITHQKNNENERSIIVIQHSDTWKGVWIPNNYFRILVEQLDLSDYLHSFLTNKVKSKQNPVKDESKSKDTPISSEIPTLLNLKLPILNDPNYFGQSFIKYEETEDNTKKSGNKGKSKNSKDNKNSDSSTSAKSKNSSKGASSSEISKNNNIPKTAPRLPFKLPNFDVTKLTLIHSRPATDPAIWITLIENVKVYMCLIPVNMDILESSDSTMTPPLIPLLRIYNNDMVNGTLLLTAGGVESEQNRSIILSLESKRVRIRKHTNGLCGTWIPLNRARELARTCSLDSKLSVFLSDNLRDYFAYNENVPTIPLPLPLGNPLLDINKSMAVAALSSLNATAAVTTAASTSTTTATTTSSTTSSTKANTKANATTGKTKEIPISMKAPNPFQTALNLLNSNRLLLNKGNILGNNPLFSNPSALSLLFKQFPFSPMSLPTGTTPKISIASNSKKNNNNSQSQKTQTTKSSTPSTTTTTASTTTTTTATTTAAAVTDAAAIAASLTTTAAAPDFTTIPTLPLTFPSIAATAPLSTTSTTDPAGFQLAFENSVDQIGKNTKPSSISQLMKTTNKMKKMKRMPVRITKKENAMLNSTLASLTNEKFQNSFLSVSPDKNNKELTVNNDNSNSSNDSEEENDQNLLFLSSSSSSENEDDKNEEVAFLSRDGYMSEVQDNKNSDDENDNSNEENLDKDDDDEDDDDEDDEEESYEENEYDEMEGTEYDEDGESEGSILSSNSDKNIINVVDDDSSEGYKSDYDNNLENMWYLKPRISGGGKTKRLNSVEYSDIIDELDATEEILLAKAKENKKESHSTKKKNNKNTSSRKKKLTTEKSSHKKSTSNKNSESHSRKKKKIINSSSNTKLILKQFPEFYSSSTPPPPSKKKKSKSKKSNKKIEIVSKSEEEEESDISIVSEHSSYIDVNSSDDNNELFDPINIINDNNDEDEDFSIDVTSSDIKTGNGKKIIIRKPSNSSTNSKKAKSDNNVTSSDKKIKSITLELSNKNGKGTKRQKKNSVSKKQSEQSELEDKKNTVVNVEPILPLSINIKRKRVTKKSSTTLTSDSPQSTASSKMVSEMNNSNDNDSDSSIINIDDSSNFNNSTNGQSSPSQVSSSVKIPSAISEEEKIRAAIMSNINLTQKIEPIPVAASTSTSTSTTSSLATSTKLTKSKKSKISSTTKPPSTENLSPSILKAIKNSQNLALLPEFQAEMKAPSKKRSKKQSFNETLSLINNPFLFPTAIPPVTNPTSTPKSKLVNIKPKDNHNHNQIYPNYNLLNEKLSLLKKVSKPIILPKFPIPILPNQGTKPPYNLLDTSSTFPNQFDFTPANLSKAAAELLSGSALPLDNKLASSFAAASTSTAIPSTATSSIDTTTSSTLPATLQSLANNLVFQSIPANIMASTLPKPNISQAQIQSLRKRTKNLKNKENVEEDDEEIDIVSDDGFDDFR